MPDAQGGPGLLRIDQRRARGLHQFLRGWLQRPQCPRRRRPGAARIWTPCRSSRWRSPATPPRYGQHGRRRPQHGDAVGHQPVSTATCSSTSATTSSMRAASSTRARIRCIAISTAPCSPARSDPEALQRPQPDVLHVQLGELQADGWPRLASRTCRRCWSAQGDFSQSFSLTQREADAHRSVRGQHAVPGQPIPASRFNPVAREAAGLLSAAQSRRPAQSTTSPPPPTRTPGTASS